ncbi:MAG: metal-dependent transcriptional regulator [Actinomycetota bacterium]|nr:metal-dependent transcriptional regulator [Actinomycetota bacterium]
MANDGFHPPLEEYLEAIHALEEEGVTVIQARLVERLQHSPQSVSEMVHRLGSEGYLERDGRGVRLTPLGRTRAESVVRKHRLAERFLVDIVGLAWHKAHLEAGRWEHVISDEVEARFVELLGNPATCPHGNPIPGAAQAETSQHPLADAEPGAHVRLARITEQVEIDLGALEYLSVHGLVPGVDATVRSKAPDGTLTLELGGTSVALGAAMCRQLFVVPA